MILFKKAIRSMWDNKSAYIACIVLIILGIAIYVGMGVSTYKLYYSQDQYYEDHNFAHIFAKVEAIHESALSSIKAIPGIRDVNFRIVQDVRVLIEDSEKIITMRLVSVDENNEEPINQLDIVEGGFYGQRDVLVSQGFLDAFSFGMEDQFQVVISGKETTFTISGVANSPEYVYSIRDEMEMLPDPETFSVGYLPIEHFFTLFSKTNDFNDIIMTLEPGYTYDDVKVELTDELQKYGLTQMYERKDQISYAMLKSEIEGNLSMSNSIPFVFIFMAVIVLYLMLKRVIEQDRGQIGTMKAFGYANAQIIGHYLCYGILTGAIGVFLGIGIGIYLSVYMTDLYGMFFNLPVYELGFGSFIIKGVLMGILGGAAGAYMGTRNIVKLSPSQAMRPDAPKPIKGDILKYMPFINYIIDSKGSMAIRSIARNKFRSAFIVMGMMFSYGLLAFMASYGTMMDDMLINQFTLVQMYDGSISLEAPVMKASGVLQVLILPGVTKAEGIIEIPVTLKHKNRSKGIVLTGLEEQSTLYRIYDNGERTYVPLSQEGIILSNKIADDLEAKRGDVLLISSPLLEEDIQVLVWDVITQHLGSSSYMEINSLAEIFQLNDHITKVIFNTEDMGYLKDYLKEGKNIKAIEDRDATLRNYYQTLESYDAMMMIFELMAIVIAVAIIYNTSTISLSERKREYATLRVLGMHANEVAQIMKFEYWVLAVIGILLGIPFTGFLKELIAKAIDADMFTMPTDTPMAAYIKAVLGAAAAVIISNWSSARKIKQFDLVEVLKERE